MIRGFGPAIGGIFFCYPEQKSSGLVRMFLIAYDEVFDENNGLP